MHLKEHAEPTSLNIPIDYADYIIGTTAHSRNLKNSAFELGNVLYKRSHS
jgi:hypothetical protein